MRDHPQKSIDAQMKQRISDYRYNYRKEQCVAGICAGTRDDPAKRRIKRIADRDNKLHKPGAAARRE